MPRTYINKVLPNKIYRADNRDLGIPFKGSHDVIVTSINKRSKKCFVKTITSLEKNIKGKNFFLNHKLSDVRNGNIIVISQPELNTKHLSGVNQNTKLLKINKLFLSNSGFIYPRKYKHIISSKK